MPIARGWWPASAVTERRRPPGVLANCRGRLPASRGYPAAAVWTGQELLIWGGYYLNSSIVEIYPTQGGAYR